MDPKLLDEDGLVLHDVLLEAAEGGLPFPCLNSWLLELGLDLKEERKFNQTPNFCQSQDTIMELSLAESSPSLFYFLWKKVEEN